MSMSGIQRGSGSLEDVKPFNVSLTNESAEEIKDELVKLSDNWLDGIHNPDDITIVVCKKLKD